MARTAAQQAALKKAQAASAAKRKGVGIAPISEQHKLRRQRRKALKVGRDAARLDGERIRANEFADKVRYSTRKNKDGSFKPLPPVSGKKRNRLPRRKSH